MIESGNLKKKVIVRTYVLTHVQIKLPEEPAGAEFVTAPLVELSFGTAHPLLRALPAPPCHCQCLTRSELSCGTGRRSANEAVAATLECEWSYVRRAQHRGT